MDRIFSVTDACKLHSLENVEILAGEHLCDHQINHINVMEVPDIENWVQKDEFLMTTGYMFRDDPEKFASLIPKLKKNDIAALGIKPKRFLDDIPECVIKKAQECELPLLKLPEQTTFSLVIRECMEQILINEKEKRASFLKNLLLGTFTNMDNMAQAANDVGISLPLNYLYTLLLVVDPNDHVFYEKESIYQKIKEQSKKDGFICHHVIHQNKLIVLLSSHANHPYLHLKNLQPLAEHYDISICSYENNLPISEISTEFIRLSHMAKSVELSHFRSPIVIFKDLGLLSVIPDLKGSIFQSYYSKKYLNTLKEYDAKQGTELYSTFYTFLNTNCNKKETATKLYTHYNTICYRISQIEELLSINTNDFSQMCAFYVSFLLDEN